MKTRRNTFSIITLIKRLFLIFLFPICAFGGSYYVSSAGSDANDGKSTTAPWQTISKVNSVTFISGDAIYFRGGDSFSGQINVNQSGITIGAYNNGLQNPIISGAVQLSNWTVYSGSIYVAQASSLVKNLFSNGNQMTIARYPNTGFLTIGSTNGSTTITATGLNQSSGYWNGATIRLRSINWAFETGSVSSFDGTTVTLSNAPEYSLKVGWGFYLDNKLAALDAPGEWYCDPSNNKVYFYAPGGVNPNTLTVAGSTFDYGVNSYQSNLTVQGLNFNYQAQAALRFSGTTTNTRILSNNIYGSFGYGILADGTSSNYTIDGNTIRLVNAGGLFLGNATSVTVKNNTVRNVGLVQGYGRSGCDGMVGIMVGGSGNTISHNIVDSVGYIGIDLGAGYGSNILVENNIVTNVMLKLSDGGAIYMYYGNANIVRNNIVSNSVGNKDGTTSPGYKEANGIYLDNGSHDIIVEGNTVSHISTSGIFLQYDSYRNTIRNNMLLDCDLDTHGNSLYILQNALYSSGQHVITHNVFGPKTAIQRLVILQQDQVVSVLDAPGIIDSNYYLNPYGNTIPFGTILNKSGGYTWDDYKFAGWQTLLAGQGQELHSKYIIPASYKHDTVFVNNTASPMTVNLPAVLFSDLDNKSVTGSFILAPFSSRMLIRDTVTVALPIALPVQLTSFNGAVQGNTVALDWNTATEVNSYMFEIERRTSTQWESIAQLPAGGTSNAPLKYTYADNLKNVGSGNIFYRLKMINNDGSFQYSSEVEVLVTTAVSTTTLPAIYALSQNYPNPFNPTTTINYQLQKAGDVSLKVYDMLGREVASLVDGNKGPGFYSAVFDASRLSSGTYIYRLKAESFTEVKKLVLLK
jgi:parallel beta-helix repeat protein